MEVLPVLPAVVVDGTSSGVWTGTLERNRYNVIYNNITYIIGEKSRLGRNMSPWNEGLPQWAELIGDNEGCGSSDRFSTSEGE